ncbi:hypothetical protein DY000_02013453 [Brassica cretica]|uniref:Uncharacterized protein n=1 Tax=Brassica cretica TaxID=69181 RepID=A0ABQ7DC59_BRACR|nr:hypothetical protein DY000_02013453 [Brassica cretica]
MAKTVLCRDDVEDETPPQFNPLAGKSGDSSKHEAVRKKSYRAASKVMPLVAKALQPPSGMKFRFPAPIVAANPSPSAFT